MDVIDISGVLLFGLLSAAFLTSILHGATGMAGGIVLAAILSHFLGVKTAIPVTTCALIISHSSRTLFYLRDTDWRSVTIVLLFSTPTIVFGATLFVSLSPAVIAAIMAAFLSLSFPLKAYAARRQRSTSNSVLAGASVLWGLLAGNVVGPGFVLAPFLLGRGMNRLAFVGSLAVIVLTMNILKLGVFGVTELVNLELLLLGIFIGLVTIPGNWLGRKVLLRVSDQTHRRVIDMMTALLIVNFVYLIFNP